MSTAQRPASRPRATREKIERIAAAEYAKRPPGIAPGVYLVGIRGYYLDSMGDAGENDRGMYDDAIFIVAPEMLAAFNANTDPSAYRKGIATLMPGVWRYKLGLHGINREREGGPPAYPALVQAEPFVVTRDGATKADAAAWIGINIHRGGDVGTSSLGCQTIPPEQWKEFYELVGVVMKKYDCKMIDYVLVENTPEINAQV